MATTIRDFHVLGHTEPPRRVYGESTVTARLVTARELWLWQNPDALRSVVRGLSEMAHGQTVSAGSFVEFADLDIDE